MIFCNVCGTKNKREDSYCKKDGTKLSKSEPNKMTVSMGNKFCSICGVSAKEEDNYCLECGEAFYTQTSKVKEELIDKKEANFLKNLIPKEAFDKIKNGNKNMERSDEDDEHSPIEFNLPEMDIETIKDGFNINDILIGGIGFMIILLLSFLLSGSVNKLFSSAISQYIGFSSVAKPLKALDVFMLFNAGTISLTGSFNYYLSVSGSLDIRIGLGIMIFIPALIFIGLGMFKGRLEKKENTNILGILSNSLVYALLVAITSLFTKSDISLQNEFFVGSKDFLFAPSFMTGFLISFLFMMIGYSIHNIRYYGMEKDNINSYIFSGVRDQFILFSIFFIITGILIFILDSDDLFIPKPLIIPDTASMLFALINLGTVKMLGGTDENSLNLFSNNSTSLEAFGIDGEGRIIFIVLMFGIIAYFFFKAYRSDEDEMSKILISPLTYALTNFFLYSLLGLRTDFSLSLQEALGGSIEYMNINIGALGIFLTSLLLAVLPTISAYFIKQGSNKKD